MKKQMQRRIEIADTIVLPSSASGPLVFEYSSEKHKIKYIKCFSPIANSFENSKINEICYDKNGRLMGSYHEGSSKIYETGETFHYGGF